MRSDAGGLDRVAANERRFLELREGGGSAGLELLCECTTDGCDQRVAIAARQYQPVRTSAARYVVAPDHDHVDARLDCVVERQPCYWVVERKSSVEVLDFYSARDQTIAAELTALATDARRLGRVTDEIDDPA